MLDSPHMTDGWAQLGVDLEGELHTDGLAQVSISLRSDALAPTSTRARRRSERERGATCDLSDVELRMPMVESATRLINGFGWKGAPRPDDVVFRWNEVSEDPGGGHGQAGLNCRVWLGSAEAGVQLNLQGLEQSKSASASHCGNDEDGRLVCDDLTDAQYNVALGSTVWYNRNAGGATVRVQPTSATQHDARRRLSRPSTHSDSRRSQLVDGGGGARAKLAMVTVFTGAVSVNSVDGLTLPFRLLLTPARGGGRPPIADFSTRYFHMQRYTTVAQATSAAPNPWIIHHQGNKLNP